MEPSARGPRLRIGLDGRVLDGGFPGIGRYTANLARALREVAPQSDLTLVTGPEAVRRTALSAPWPKGWTRIGIDSRPGALREGARLRRLTCLRRLSLFHSTYFRCASRLPCPLVVSIHDVIPHRLWTRPGKLPTRFLYELAIRRALRRASIILTGSQAAKRDLVSAYSVADDKVVVTPYAADPNLRPASAAAVAELRRRLDLGVRYCLTVGSSRPHKNLERLVAAWTEVVAVCGDDLRLVIAGPDDRWSAVARREADRRSLRSVRFVGEVDEADLAALYTGALVCVQPSLAEGFGLCVLEAMACGSPVACSDIEAHREVGRDAVARFDPKRPDAIAATIVDLVHDADRRSVLADEGRLRAAGFSWLDTARATLEAYRAVSLPGGVA